MAISLEQARGEMSWCVGQGNPRAEDSDLLRWADAITAHITQPAQAVDVGEAYVQAMVKVHDAKSRALAGEQADAVARGQSLGMVVYHDDENAAAKLEGRRVLIVLDPSPTPDKDQR